MNIAHKTAANQFRPALQEALSKWAKSTDWLQDHMTSGHLESLESLLDMMTDAAATVFNKAVKNRNVFVATGDENSNVKPV